MKISIIEIFQTSLNETETILIVKFENGKELAISTLGDLNIDKVSSMFRMMALAVEECK